MRRNGIARILEGAAPGALSQALERALAERRQAPALCAELMALSPRQRRRAVERQHRFANLGLVAHLLSPAHPAADAGASRERARLALGLVAQLRPGRYPQGLVWDLTGRAWVLLGGARASQGDEPGAEAAFLRARTALELGSRDPLERALLLRHQARLRRLQGRELECRHLLRQARDLYLEVGDLGSASAVESAQRHTRLGCPPTGLFDLRSHALLLAAVLGPLCREPLFRLDREHEPRGFALETLRGERWVSPVGWLPIYQPQIAEALHLAEGIVRSPQALASLMEAAGPTPLELAMELLGLRLAERAREEEAAREGEG